MKVLGIETSCDETGAAVVEDGTRILSNVIASQIDLHAAYGGVVPELASRAHVELILPVINKALDEAGCTLDDIDCIGAINRPGLIGALIVGVAAAKTIAYGAGIPLVGVNHLEAHIYANWLREGAEREGEAHPEQSRRTAEPNAGVSGFEGWEHSPMNHESSCPSQPGNPETRPRSAEPRDIEFPLICLVVSGGHSDIVYMSGHGQYEILARTRDDAAGEAFDKCARVMGLGYPGGPLIDKAALTGNPHAVEFPRAKVGDTLDFSFSGLKTAVIRYVQSGSELPIEDLAASFQQAIVDVLVDHTFRAAGVGGDSHRRSAGKGDSDRRPDSSRRPRPTRVLMAGGVAANSALQAAMKARGEELGIHVTSPPPLLCTDNAAMAACAAFFAYERGEVAGLDLDCYASEPLGHPRQ